MIECKKCKKQYIDETKRTLRERFFRTQTNYEYSPSRLGLIPLELQPTPSASRRKAREDRRNES